MFIVYVQTTSLLVLTFPSDRRTMSDTESTTEKFSHHLVSQYSLMKEIFSYLSFEDLQSCSSVCKAWREACNVLMKKRSDFQLLVVKEKDKPYILSGAQATFTFGNFRKKRNMHPNICSKQILNIWTNQYFLWKHWDPKFPENYADTDMTQITLRCPSWNNCYIKCGELSSKRISTSRWNDILDIPVNIPIKALLIFRYSDSVQTEINISTFLKKLWVRQDSFAIAGCNILDNEDIGARFVIFAGESVVAVSRVNKERTRTAVVESIRDFSRFTVPAERHVLFALRCIARYLDDAECNVTTETKEIQESFPKCAIIGVHGDGEYGIDFPPRGDNSQRTKKRRQAVDELNDISHAYSTAYLYIAFKNNG